MRAEPAPRASFRTWCGLLVLLLPALLAAMDISVLFVAGPAIAATLRPTATEWLWAMDIYTFVSAGLLITMGCLGDRFGRRRVLLIGAGVFGAASAVVAYAPNPELLILARALLAVGGATLAPATLSLIRGMFADEGERRTAVAAWGIAFAGGAVAGPVAGGLLLEYFWWGAVFLINVPVMILLLIAAPFVVVESRSATRGGFDVAGAATSLVAVLSFVFALKDVARYGISVTGAAAVLVGVAATVVFLARQRRAAYPLIDLELFRVRTFSTGVVANTVVAVVTAGLGVLAFPFLQLVHGLTPLQSALWAVPTFAGSFVGAAAAAALARRHPATPLLGGGLLAAAIGLAVITTVEPAGGLWRFLGGYTILTFGVGVTATIANSFVLDSAPPERVGTASGIAETSTQLGSALGIAVLGTLAGAIYRTTMASAAPVDTDPAALETVADAVVAAHQSSPQSAATLLDAAYAAYTDGVTTVALVGAILTAALATLALTTPRRTP
ncbi:MFS transporter [Actinopolymorpha alba]|uniref:MFS transporter n=1 Tax=Actinopolymorpha alba TaxID=533267 RepID=UPI000371B085|nr:MFS transporter [Actinopolymorpha alba]